MELDNTSGKERDLKADLDAPTPNSEVSNSARRRFTRNALLGSAVAFSLSNRTAWGYTGTNVGECMSGPTLASFTLNGNAFASFNPNNDETVAQDIVDLNSAGGQIQNHVACPQGDGYCITTVNDCNSNSVQQDDSSPWVPPGQR